MVDKDAVGVPVPSVMWWHLRLGNDNAICLEVWVPGDTVEQAVRTLKGDLQWIMKGGIRGYPFAPPAATLRHGTLKFDTEHAVPVLLENRELPEGQDPY